MIECNHCKSILFMLDLMKVDGFECRIDDTCPKCNANWNIIGFRLISKEDN